MFKKIWDGLGRHKYKLISMSIIIIFSLFNFIWVVTTGEYLDVRENKSFLLVLLIFRCLIYLILFVLVERNLKGSVKIFLGRLLAFTILFYELVVVFNIPMLLIERLG